MKRCIYAVLIVMALVAAKMGSADIYNLVSGNVSILPEKEAGHTDAYSEVHISGDHKNTYVLPSQWKSTE